MKDTSQKIEDQYRRLLMSKSNYERLVMGTSMYDTAKKCVEMSVKWKNPNITKSECRKEIFKRMYQSDFEPEQFKKLISNLTF